MIEGNIIKYCQTMRVFGVDCLVVAMELIDEFPAMELLCISCPDKVIRIKYCGRYSRDYTHHFVALLGSTIWDPQHEHLGISLQEYLDYVIADRIELRYFQKQNYPTLNKCIYECEDCLRGMY